MHISFWQRCFIDSPRLIQNVLILLEIPGMVGWGMKSDADMAIISIIWRAEKPMSVMLVGKAKSI